MLPHPARTAPLALVLAAALPAGAAQEQRGNDLPLSNQPRVRVVLSDPSVGGPTGVFPSDPTAVDQFWTVVPREVLDCSEGTIRVDGFWEYYFDSDYSTDGDLYDRVIGNAYELGPLGGSPGCARVPSWVALGAPDGSEILVSLGPAGLPDFCTPPGAPPGEWDPPSSCFDCDLYQQSGYAVSFSGFEIDVPCDGATDLALTYFVPGGMSATGPGPGPYVDCDTGDFVYQTYWSEDETPGDCCGDGVSPFSGYGVAGSFFIDPLHRSPGNYLQLAADVVNVVARTSSAAGLEQSWNAGGARNALCLDTSGGEAGLAIELRDVATATSGTPHVALTAFSFGRVPAPGTPVLGADVMIVPDALVGLTLATGTVALTVPVFTDEGIFLSPTVAVPPGTSATVHAQGFVVDLVTSLAEETQVASVTTL